MKLNQLKHVKQKHITLLFFIAYFIIGLSIFPDYGIGWDDECSRVYTGYINYDYIVNKAVKPLLEGNEKYHGPFFEIVLVLVEKATNMKDTQQIYMFRHVAMFLLFFLSVITFYHSAKRMFNDKLALLACLLLVISPRIFAESFYNTKDIGLLAMFNFSFFSFLLFYEKKNIKWAILHGLFTGMLIGVRILGILMPILTIVYFVIWLVMNRDQKVKALHLLVYLISTIVFTIICWPVLWEGPIEHFYLAFAEMKKYHWGMDVLYDGQLLIPSKLPWHYLPLWIWISTPILYCVLFVFGIFFYCRNSFKMGFKLFIENYKFNSALFLCISPIAAIIIFHSTVYDGWRHVYFIYPFLILLSVYGVSELLKLNKPSQLIKYVLLSLFSIQSITLIFWMIKNHPFQQVYFNPLAKIIFKPIGENFELDYWGLSYKQGIDYLLEKEKGRMRIGFSNTPGIDNMLSLSPNEKLRVEGTVISESDSFDYYITNYRYDRKPRKGLIKAFYVDDIPILGVYKFKK